MMLRVPLIQGILMMLSVPLIQGTLMMLSVPLIQGTIMMLSVPLIQIGGYKLTPSKSTQKNYLCGYLEAGIL